MKVVFLDIDGVLNGHEFCHMSKSCLLKPACVQLFNEIIVSTGAKVVLSSSWRYLIHGGSQTISGFEYMLRTHGVTEQIDIVGITCLDEEEGYDSRDVQILKYVGEHPEIESYVVLDDLELKNPFLVKTHERYGLSDHDVERAIAILNRTTASAAAR